MFVIALSKQFDKIVFPVVDSLLFSHLFGQDRMHDLTLQLSILSPKQQNSLTLNLLGPSEIIHTIHELPFCTETIK